MEKSTDQLLRKQRSNPLIQYIQPQSKLLVVINGSTYLTISGGSLIITTEKGKEIITGSNPDFGMNEHIHSHRAEICRVNNIFLFLQEYCSYFFIELISPIEFYCDNEEVITKLIQLIADINYFNEKHKHTYLDAVMKLK